jgi:hypothetical protein
VSCNASAVKYHKATLCRVRFPKKTFSTLKNTLTYNNASVVVVNSVNAPKLLSLVLKKSSTAGPMLVVQLLKHFLHLSQKS